MRLSTKRNLRDAWRRDREFFCMSLFIVALMCSAVIAFGYGDPDSPTQSTEQRP
jgi:hypothetical protein